MIYAITAIEAHGAVCDRCIVTFIRSLTHGRLSADLLLLLLHCHHAIKLKVEVVNIHNKNLKFSLTGRAYPGQRMPELD